MNEKKVISIIGPTGIGKTKLAIEIAKILNTEIISSDARQFYREMPIGTAMPTEEEIKQVPHHFIAHLSVENEYSIGKYEQDALEKLNSLFETHDIIVLVGGSGMYEKALTEGLNNLPKSNQENQKKLHNIWKEKGIETLQNMLKKEDVYYFNTVDIHNPRRLLRALDIIWQTGKSYTENINTPKKARNFNFQRIEITANREIIYDRINKRIDSMIEKGLLKEVENLIKYRNKTALQTVGYTELFKYFDGEYSLDNAIEEIKKNSRKYAKRQITWCKKLKHISSIEYNYTHSQIKALLSNLRGLSTNKKPLQNI